MSNLGKGYVLYVTTFSPLMSHGTNITMSHVEFKECPIYDALSSFRVKDHTNVCIDLCEQFTRQLSCELGETSKFLSCHQLATDIVDKR